MRAIDADALENDIREWIKAKDLNYEYGKAVGLEIALKCVTEALTITPERKCGRWEMLQISISPPVYKCSVCGSHALQTLTGCLVNRHYESNLTKFCPNCGAKMKEGEAE